MPAEPLILDYARARPRRRVVNCVVFFLLYATVAPGAAICTAVVVSFFKPMAGLTTGWGRIAWLLAGVVVMGAGLKMLQWVVKPTRSWNN